jgi:hypothetical protein
MKEYMREFFKGFIEAIDLFKSIRAEDMGSCAAIVVVLSVFVAILMGIGALLT